MEDSLFLWNKIVTGEKRGRQRPRRNLVESPWPLSRLPCHLLSFASVDWGPQWLLPTKPLPCWVLSSLLFPPAPSLSPASCCGAIQWLTLSSASLYTWKVTEGQSVNNLCVVVEYQLGIEKKRQLLESSSWSNQHQTWIASAPGTASTNMRAKFCTVLKYQGFFFFFFPISWESYPAAWQCSYLAVAVWPICVPHKLTSLQQMALYVYSGAEDKAETSWIDGGRWSWKSLFSITYVYPFLPSRLHTYSWLLNPFNDTLAQMQMKQISRTGEGEGTKLQRIPMFKMMFYKTVMFACLQHIHSSRKTETTALNRYLARVTG